METKGRHTLQCIDVARAGLGEPARQSGKELLWRCPHSEQHNHGDRNPSLGVNPEKNVWKCWSEGVGGKGGWSFAAFIAGVDANDKPAVTAWLRNHELLSGSGGAVGEVAKGRARKKATEEREVAQYNYTDEEGDLLFQVVRYEPKNFRQRRPDGNDGWVWHLECDAKCKCKVKLPPARRVLYKLPELEKVPRAWKRSGLITILEPTSPQQEAEEKRIIEAWIPNLPYVLVVEGEKDVAAAEALGFTATCNPMGAKKWRDEYSQFLEGSRVVIIADADVDGTGQVHAQQVAASLDGWAASIKVINNLPGSNVKDLSDFAALPWHNGPADCKQALLNLCSDAPEWKPASGADVLGAVYNFIRRPISLSESQARVVTLWAAHTHALDAAEFTPYLAITSPEKRCGKSRLLKVLWYLVRNPWKSGSASAAVLAHKIDSEQPTLLLDESDATFNGPSEYSELLRGVLNNGFERDGGTYDRMEGQGANQKPVSLNVFCPKAIAGIGRLPDTVADRSIPIRMQRAIAGQVQRFRGRDLKKEAAPIAAKLTAWCAVNEETLRETRLPMIGELNDRQNDFSEPLLIIAEIAGGEWPEAGRRAIVELCAQAEAEDDSLSTQLLHDIKAILEAGDIDRITSEHLATALAGMEDRPWPEMPKSHKPITVAEIARLLRRHNIRPGNIRLDGGEQRKGYKREWFIEAWEHYPPPPDSKRPTLPMAEDSGRGELFGTVPRASQPVVPAVPEKAWDGAGMDLGRQLGRDADAILLNENAPRDAGTAGTAFPGSGERRCGKRYVPLTTGKPWPGRPPRPETAHESECYSGVCWIDLNRGEIGRYGGSGLGKAVVRGHETAMLDTGNLQRRPLDGSGMERATLDKSGIETRDRRK